MTVLVANVDSTTDTFGQWVSKTNIIASALSNVVVTTNSNTTVGNAAISGAFTANALYSNNISGGDPSAAANTTFSSNAIFTQNVYFSGILTQFGQPSSIQINGGNSSVRVLTVNSAAGNTLSVTKLTTSDIADINTTSLTDGQLLAYNSSTSQWYNSNVVTVSENTSTVTVGNNTVNTQITSSSLSATVIIANTITVGNSTVNVTINSTSVAVGGGSTLRVYYANNSQAFP